MGIPYAKPPEGELRWKAPRDPEAWTEVYQADSFSEACPQTGGMMSYMDPEIMGKAAGSEDCLYLNIWRPRNDDKDLNVYFWIHGGGNHVGQASYSLYHGAQIASKYNMVFVSINYRMGPFGWFTHPTFRDDDPADSSGNYGNLDHLKALDWVRANIEEFGGDPNKITISGESAGGTNVFSLLASPLAAGKFQNAIIQTGFPGSGSLSGGDEAAETLAITLLVREGAVADRAAGAEYVDAMTDEEFVAYLRGKTPKEILECFAKGPYGVVTNYGAGTFSDGHVLPEEGMMEAFRNGNYNIVPVIMGCNAEEAKLILPLLPTIGRKTEKGFCEMIRNFNTEEPNYTIDEVLSPLWIPPSPMYNTTTETVNNTVLKPTTVDEPARLMAEHQDVYAYIFDWREQPEPVDFLIGASHALDIPFTLGNFQQDVDSGFRFAWNEANHAGREKLSGDIMTYWEQFARTGDPNVEGLPEWVPWSNEAGGPKRIKLKNDKMSMSTREEVKADLETLAPVERDLAIKIMQVFKP